VVLSRSLLLHWTFQVEWCATTHADLGLSGCAVKQLCPDFIFSLFSRCVSQVLLKYCCHFQLVSSASHFLATVADRAQYKYLFEGPDVLTSICKDVIIPNMVFRGKRMVQATHYVPPYFLCWHSSYQKIQVIYPKYCQL